MAKTFYPCCCGAALDWDTDDKEAPDCTNPACDHYMFKEKERLRWCRYVDENRVLKIGLFHSDKDGRPTERIPDEKVNEYLEV